MPYSASPPGLTSRLKTITSCPACAIFCAANSPAGPAPTTNTVFNQCLPWQSALISQTILVWQRLGVDLAWETSAPGYRFSAAISFDFNPAGRYQKCAMIVGQFPRNCPLPVSASSDSLANRGLCGVPDAPGFGAVG